MKTLEAEKQSQSDTPICPVCRGQAVTYMLHKMENVDTKQTSLWWHCVCGVVWQNKIPVDVCKQFGKEYLDILLKDKRKYADSMAYPSRVYGPLLEEMTYGRKMLDVGYASPYSMMSFAKRGWVAYGIDNSPVAEETPRLIKADYETFKFPDDLKFDLIWMSNVLENFSDPLMALEKAYNLMPENGILFLATPDTDFIYHNSPRDFSHWNPETNHILWSGRKLKAVLEEMGFEIILHRKNFEHRFTSWDAQHLIAQKKFY